MFRKSSWKSHNYKYHHFVKESILTYCKASPCHTTGGICSSSLIEPLMKTMCNTILCIFCGIYCMNDCWSNKHVDIWTGFCCIFMMTSHMETFSALLVLCDGKPPVIGGFPSQRPVTRSFDVGFDVRLVKRFDKQWNCWWFETPFCACDVTVMLFRCGYVFAVGSFVNRFSKNFKVAPLALGQWVTLTNTGKIDR